MEVTNLRIKQPYLIHQTTNIAFVYSYESSLKMMIRGSAHVIGQFLTVSDMSYVNFMH